MDNLTIVVGGLIVLLSVLVSAGVVAEYFGWD